MSLNFYENKNLLEVMQSIERGEPEQGLSSIMAICSVL